jgi:hypothetical protein
MVDAGVRVFSDDGNCVPTARLLRNALTYVRNTWGNSGDAIALGEVNKFRKDVVAPAPSPFETGHGRTGQQANAALRARRNERLQMPGVANLRQFREPIRRRSSTAHRWNSSRGRRAGRRTERPGSQGT